MKTRTRRFRPSLYALIVLLGSTGLADDGGARIRLSLPLPEELPATGAFGEYRSGHFHAGLDFSTRNELGWPVRAAADGEVIRLKVQARGYGRALYLRHANGFQTVYGHLHAFENPELGLEDFVAGERRRLGQRFPGDLYPAQPIPVRRGQIIGLSGEKGSGPAHLHFELRLDGAPVDPIRYGEIVPRGFSTPQFQELWILPRGPCRVDGRWAPASFPFRRTKQGVSLGTAPVLEGTCDLAVKGRVPGTGSMSLSKLDVDCGEGVFLRMDLGRFTFDQHRQVGLLYEPERSTSGRFLYRLRPAAGLDLDGVASHGFGSMAPGKRRCVVRGEAATGQEANASFTLDVRSSVPYASEPPSSVNSFQLFEELLLINAESAFDPQRLPGSVSSLPGVPFIRAPGAADAFPPLDGIHLRIEPGDLFAPVAIGWSEEAVVPPAPTGLKRLGAAVRLEPAGLFLRREAILSTRRSSRVPDLARAGFFRMGRNGKRWFSIGGVIEGDRLSAGTRTGGTFAVLEDNSPPRIGAVRVQVEKRLGARRLVFPIDEVGLGIEWDAFHVLIDGKKVEAEYDPDRKWGQVWLRAGVRGSHRVEAQCRDRAGNEAAPFRATVKL